MDDALEKVGFGLWQVPPILTLSMIQGFAAVGFISSVFVNKSPNIDININSSLLNNKESDIMDSNLDMLSSDIYDNVTQIQPYETGYLMYYNRLTYLEKWTVDSTIASEFNIQGDRAWLSPLYQMGFVIGVILGDLIGAVSHLSDTYGRVFTIRIATVGSIIGQLVISFMPYFSGIIICRIVAGLSYSVIYGSAFNLVMETTPMKYRALVSTLIALPYYISAILLGVSAYFIRNWRVLHLLNSVYVIILSVSVVFLKNSPHWLLQKRRVTLATGVIEWAYECNNKNAPPLEMNFYPNNKEISQYGTSRRRLSWTEQKVMEVSETTTSLFKTKNMRVVSIVHPMLFTLIGFIYYGIALNANNFTDNPYLYVIVIEVMEMVPSLLGGFILNKFGNINSITILSMIAGICMFSIMIFNYVILDWVLLVVAEMSVGLIYLVCWMLSSELFPTSLRSTGFGMCSFACHFGSLIASYIFDSVARTFPMVPSLISVILCIVSACLVRFLPETHGSPLCENINDVEKREIKLYSIPCHNKAE
ncbi:unnamed protein product [Meganyctiphanes norvegica]|uniref:Major facilitator superfamily (MFS) profile domain-containing protein n=1 Tax=Meganyctiphanes norvegica TaxID=48144 RepID=A0AAV2RE02_MEGNR